MLAALCFVAGAPIAPPGANVSAAEPPPPAAANVSALVAASAAGDAVNSAALLQEVLAEVRQLRGRVEELAQAPAPDARAPLKPRTPAARRPPLPTLPTLSSSSRRQSSLAAAAGQSLLAFRPAVLMPAAASGPGSTLLAGLESLVHGVVGNATSSLLARPGYSPATLLAAKKTLTACATWRQTLRFVYLRRNGDVHEGRDLHVGDKMRVRQMLRGRRLRQVLRRIRVPAA